MFNDGTVNNVNNSGNLAETVVKPAVSANSNIEKTLKNRENKASNNGNKGGKTGIILVDCSDLKEGRRIAYDKCSASGFNSAQIEVVDSPNRLWNTGLFDDALIRVLMLDYCNSEYCDKVVDTIEANFNKINSCIIIITNIPVTTTLYKRLSKLAKSTILSKNVTVSSQLELLAIKDPLKQAILGYIGENTALFAPLFKWIKTLDLTAQWNLTWDDIQSHIVTSPTGELPWAVKRGEYGLDDFIYQRKTGSALQKTERLLNGGSTEFSIVGWLIGQVDVLTQIAALCDDGLKPTEIAHVLGLPDPAYRQKGAKDPKTGKNGYPTYIKIQRAKTLGFLRLTSMSHILHQTECLLKGNIKQCKLDTMPIMTRMVVKLCK